MLTFISKSIASLRSVVWFRSFVYHGELFCTIPADPVVTYQGDSLGKKGLLCYWQHLVPTAYHPSTNQPFTHSPEFLPLNLPTTCSFSPSFQLFSELCFFMRGLSCTALVTNQPPLACLLTRAWVDLLTTCFKNCLLKWISALLVLMMRLLWRLAIYRCNIQT